MKRKILFATFGVMFGMLSLFPINSSAENKMYPIDWTRKKKACLL